ncbi:MAG: DUF3089 domain-containing protein [Deltaproteobacteria bacterium]|nr:DUF3089 domain-containing protein [Deltaproteobacteria bacterium]
MLLLPLIACDPEDTQDSFRFGKHGHGHGHGQHGHGHHGHGHGHGHGHHGHGHGGHGHGGHGHGHHGKGKCEKLDIRDLLEDYDEESNPYSDPELWLSGPDALDDYVLSVNLDTTIVYPDLSTEVIHPKRPEAPDVDIFFIHPTVNLDLAPGNDDMADLTNTKLFVKETAARFSTIGRVVTPLYRSATAGCFTPEHADTREQYLAVAYQDIEDAFRYYLANHWNGRKLVIMGYSQGGALTRMLMQNFVAGHPELMSRVVAVLPMSADVQADSFDFIQPCEDPEETGCFITYSAYLEGQGPQAGTLFPEWIGTKAACVNVAGAAGEPGIFTMSYFSLPEGPGLLPADALTDIPLAIETPFMAFPAFYAAGCVAEDFVYLETAQVDDEDEQRWVPIDYTHPFVDAKAAFGMGLHAFDYSLAMGDLLELLADKADQLEDNDEFCVCAK